jgi:anti-sigma28 factor (negative regulator of flagellin synthesis)
MNRTENRKKSPTRLVKTRRKPAKLPVAKPLPGDIAQWIEKAKVLPDVRQELVARVKAEIEAGTYETPEKLEIAARRLLEELLGQ